MIAATRRDFLRLAGSAAASVVSASTLLVPDAEAGAFACGTSPALVRLDASSPDPILDNSQTQHAIQALAPGYHGGRTIGLYYAEVEAKIETRFRSVGLRGGKAAPACIFITAIDVGIIMPKRQIYVASELWPGTCQHTAVLEHERKHQATDDAAIRKHGPHVRQAIQDAVTRLGPIEASAGEHDAVQARLQKAVQSAFDKAWAAFMAERTELQHQVDAGLEYARVTASCPDWSAIHQ
jgi:hypothetical protein